jgi:hypothetical protein
VYRRLISMALEELRLIDEQISRLDRELAGLLKAHQDAVERLAEVSGLGVDSPQKIIAEVGPTAAVFPLRNVFLLGRCPPGQRRDSRRQLQPPLSPRQSSHATAYSIGCECWSPDHRKFLRLCQKVLTGGVKVESQDGPAPRTQSNNRSHCPSTVPPDLADLARGGALRMLPSPVRH